MGQVIVLQAFPLLLRLRVSNWCHLAESVPFCRGLLFTCDLVRKKIPLSDRISLPAMNIGQKELCLVDSK